MAFLTKITIDGTDVSSYLINYSIDDVTNGMTNAYVIFSQTIIDNINFETQAELVITRGSITSTDYTIFKGNVSIIKKAGGANIQIEAKDKLWLLDRIILTKTYDINIDSQAGVISAIAQDLIETHGGLTAEVVNTGTTNTLDKFYLLNRSLLDALNELAKLVDYVVYYDASTDKVKFKSNSYESFATTLQIGVNVINIPIWDYNYGSIANIVTVTGDYQELETTKTDIGDGTTTVYTLDYSPESVKVYVDSVLKTGGVIGQNSSYDYSVDKENKQITFTTAPGNTLAISFEYSYLEPIVVTQKNPSSRTKYGDYAVAKYIDTIKTTTDAEEKVQEIIDKFGEPIKSTKLQIVGVWGLQAGMKTTVVDTINDENIEIYTRRVTYNYPQAVDEIEVDTEQPFKDYILQREIDKRIARLERKNQSRGTLINQLFLMDRTFKPRRRYLKLQKQVITDTNSLIWDHPSNQGKWNDGGSITTKWGGTAFGSITTQKLVQGNMTYEEYCYDTDFHDSVNSTATFSTVTNDISFTDGQIWYSEAIDIGTTLTAITVTLGTTVGTLVIEISSDNKSTWQTVSDGIRTAVTTSDGTGTFIRITSTGVSSIDLTQDSYGQNTAPVIKAQMED